MDVWKKGVHAKRTFRTKKVNIPKVSCEDTAATNPYANPLRLRMDRFWHTNAHEYTDHCGLHAVICACTECHRIVSLSCRRCVRCVAILGHCGTNVCCHNDACAKDGQRVWYLSESKDLQAIVERNTGGPATEASHSHRDRLIAVMLHWVPHHPAIAARSANIRCLSHAFGTSCAAAADTSPPVTARAVVQANPIAVTSVKAEPAAEERAGTCIKKFMSDQKKAAPRARTPSSLGSPPLVPMAC